MQCMASKGKRKKRFNHPPKSVVCGEKTQYPSKAAAEQMRQNYIDNKGTNPDSIKAYQCKYCKHFHVGRKWRSDFRRVQNQIRQWK
jgi:hypothetical protein